MVLRDGRKGSVTSDVMGVGSVGKVPDCAVGVLCWSMRGEIFGWCHSFFSVWLGQFLRVQERDVWGWVSRSQLRSSWYYSEIRPAFWYESFGSILE